MLLVKKKNLFRIILKLSQVVSEISLVFFVSFYKTIFHF